MAFEDTIIDFKSFSIDFKSFSIDFNKMFAKLVWVYMYWFITIICFKLYKWIEGKKNLNFFNRNKHYKDKQ